MDAELINKRTRDIYHKQHTRILEDEETRKRIMNIPVDEDFFKFKKNYFKGKKVLDAGCGSIIRNAIGYAHLGATDIVALDLGDDWFATAKQNMIKNSVDENIIELISGNITELPFENNSFDFVSCDGVITHLAGMNQVKKAISELCRVTKEDGDLFISFMAGGGLIESALSDTSKKFYRENSSFKEFIDNIEPADLHEAITFITDAMEKHGTPVASFAVNMFKKLVDEDLCIGIQNTLQSDTREMHPISLVNEILKENGFSELVRLKRYVKRSNIRKFVAPLHYYSENKYAKFLYGDGWVDGKSRKISR